MTTNARAQARRSAQPHALKRHAVALAAACLIAGALPTSAWALSLGRITVQSALGEPLRAEITLLESRPAELQGLRVSLAGPEAFRAAGLEYNPAFATARITVVNLPDGRDALRLSIDRPINDPFLDLLVVAEWPGGRIVRTYTVLIDPPTARAATPQLPMVAPPATPAAVPAVPSAAVPAPAAGRRSGPKSSAGDRPGPDRPRRGA